MLVYFFWKSISFPLHDFANSYFPAHITNNSDTPEEILFDIYNYNRYIWNLGYEDVLADFYLNSPFNATFFYPFLSVENAFSAKIIFNFLSILLFVVALYILFGKFGKKVKWLFVLIPIICFVPLRNHILFGQSYFLVFALVVFSYALIEKQKKIIGSGLLTVVALLKIFPVLYGLPLLFKKDWKIIISAVGITIVLLVLSILLTGTTIWETYLFEIIPNAIKNKSTVNFQYNGQSMDVFLKTLFVKDSYYNPDAIFDNEQLFYILKWLFKSLIIGTAISISIAKKNKYFALLSIWVVTLFLIQSRTATYAQVLWLIPLFYVMSLSISKRKQITLLMVLFLVCNIPVSSLGSLPLVFKFSRLWLSLILASLFFTSLVKRIDYRFVVLGLLLMIPLHLDMFSKPEKDLSEYVLEQKDHFMIFDFKEENDVLIYNALGKNGNDVVITEIALNSFNEEVCHIIDNQIVMDGKQLTNSPDVKKKPVLVNDCEVFYLTDSRSRRGAFTIKKLNICNAF